MGFGKIQGGNGFLRRISYDNQEPPGIQLSVALARFPCFYRRPLGAVSSAVEHLLHTQGVAGSNPAPRTICTGILTPNPSFQGPNPVLFASWCGQESAPRRGGRGPLFTIRAVRADHRRLTVKYEILYARPGDSTFPEERSDGRLALQTGITYVDNRQVLLIDKLPRCKVSY
jgi:hypothetical protein